MKQIRITFNYAIIEADTRIVLIDEATNEIVYDDFLNGRYFIDFNWDEETNYVLVIHALELLHIRLTGFPNKPSHYNPIPTYHITGMPDRTYITSAPDETVIPLCTCALCGLLRHQEYLELFKKGEIDGPIVDKVGLSVPKTSI